MILCVCGKRQERTLSFSGTTVERPGTIINCRLITYSLKRLTDNNNKLTKDQKKEILQDLETYNRENTKPSFVNPGYPDYSKVLAENPFYLDHKEAIDKFHDKYSVQEEKEAYDRESKEHIVEDWMSKHPEVSPSKVEEVLDKKLEKQYRKDSREDEYAGLNVKEARWREKLDYKSMEYGKGERSPADSGIDSPASPARYEDTDSGVDEEFVRTPSVAVPPSQEDNNSERSYWEEHTEDWKYFDQPSSGSESQESDDEENLSKDPESIKEDITESKEDNTSNKRAISEEYLEENNKRPKLEDSDNKKPSAIDFVLEKQSTEMPDIAESDGGD